MPGTTMRAARYERYGPPEVLEVHAVPVPEPRAGEVLVRVDATSVNPAEALVRSGGMRLLSGRRFPRGTGQDFAGEIVATGPGVNRSLLGLRVWGTALGLNSATAAEYVAIRESLTASAPARLDPVSAAALPTVGLTALLALRTVRIAAGARLLVVGASGGIGSVVVQLARAASARVATVSSREAEEFCRELGAAETYDYRRPELLPAGRRFDAIVDLHGTALATYRARLRRGGRMVTLAARGMGYALWSAALPGPRVRLAQAKATRDGLARLAGHVERGELRPVVQRVYPLEEIAEAHRALERGGSRGKRVVRVAAVE